MREYKVRFSSSDEPHVFSHPSTSRKYGFTSATCPLAAAYLIRSTKTLYRVDAFENMLKHVPRLHG